MNPYASLIQSFLSLSAPEAPPLTEDPGPLEFSLNEQTCLVIPINSGELIVLEANAFNLNDHSAKSREVTLRMLHGLNWTSFVENGIVALLDETDNVLASVRLKTRSLDAQNLSEEMAAVLAASVNLKSVIQGLSDASNAGERKETFTAPPTVAEWMLKV